MIVGKIIQFFSINFTALRGLGLMIYPGYLIGYDFQKYED